MYRRSYLLWSPVILFNQPFRTSSGRATTTVGSMVLLASVPYDPLHGITSRSRIGGLLNPVRANCSQPRFGDKPLKIMSNLYPKNGTAILKGLSYPCHFFYRQNFRREVPKRAKKDHHNTSGRSLTDNRFIPRSWSRPCSADIFLICMICMI